MNLPSPLRPLALLPWYMRQSTTSVIFYQPSDDVRITEGGDTRITEASDTRIPEIYWTSSTVQTFNLPFSNKQLTIPADSHG